MPSGDGAGLRAKRTRPRRMAPLCCQDAGAMTGVAFRRGPGCGFTEEPAIRVWGRSRWSQRRALVVLPDSVMSGLVSGVGVGAQLTVDGVADPSFERASGFGG